MRPIGRVAGAALLAWAAVAVAAPAAQAQDVPGAHFEIHIESQHRAAIVGGEPGHPGRTTGYWGSFDGDASGSYRATCTWLGEYAPDGQTSKRDPRLVCTILFSFRAEPGDALVPNGGSLVAQGLMLRPYLRNGLFTRESRRNPNLPKRTLPIIGASGSFRGKQGVIWIKGASMVWVDFGATPQ